jgi:hypothetical protein
MVGGAMVCLPQIRRGFEAVILEAKPVRAKKVHFICFACDKHFDNLWLSLKSLERLNLDSVGNIHLFIDKQDYLSSTHSEALNRLALNLVIHKGEKVWGWGYADVTAEIKSFLQVAAATPSQDYVAKTDSDVLFLSGETFSKVLESGQDAYGHLVNYWEPVIYFQGGCYFIKAALLGEFRSFDMDILPRVLEAMNNETARSRQRFHRDACPEDAAIYHFLKTKTDRIALKEFFGSRRDLYDLKKAFTMIHYNGCREKMTRFELFKATLLRNALIKSGPFGTWLTRLAKAIPNGIRSAKRNSNQRRPDGTHATPQ